MSGFFWSRNNGWKKVYTRSLWDISGAILNRLTRNFSISARRLSATCLILERPTLIPLGKLWNKRESSLFSQCEWTGCFHIRKHRAYSRLARRIKIRIRRHRFVNKQHSRGQTTALSSSHIVRSLCTVARERINLNSSVSIWMECRIN